jgi:endogenous inhibitor of DNA gyrase (YacG/DUF329 family)
MRKQIILHCYNCGKEFTRNLSERKQSLQRGNKPFCCKKCALETNDSKITLKCAHCNKRIKRTRSQIKRSKKFFCSHKCAAHVTKNSKYIDGKSTYRDLAIKHYGPRCKKCGYSIIEALQVHHIDKNRTNNDISNLLVLCSNCHVLIHKNINNDIHN